MYKVLSLDGGGIKGIFTAVMLDRLSYAVPGFPRDVDLYSGTSTGGILALLMAAGHTPRRAVDLYRSLAARVFRDTLWDNARDLWGLAGAEYDNRNLEKCLLEFFEDKKLGDLRPVLIPSYSLSNGLRRALPRFFENLSDGPDRDEYVVNIALRTSAAPLFFPSHQGYIDGAVVANNPSMAALAAALDAHKGNQTMDQIHLLSLGTGSSPFCVEGQRLDWGVLRWARPLVRILMDGSMTVADYQCRQILGPRYRRLNPILPDPVGLDAVDRVEDLIEWGRGVELGEVEDWMRRGWTA